MRASVAHRGCTWKHKSCLLQGLGLGHRGGGGGGEGLRLFKKPDTAHFGSSTARESQEGRDIDVSICHLACAVFSPVVISSLCKRQERGQGRRGWPNSGEEGPRGWGECSPAHLPVVPQPDVCRDPQPWKAGVSTVEGLAPREP